MRPSMAVVVALGLCCSAFGTVSGHPAPSLGARPALADWAYGGTLERSGSGAVGKVLYGYDDHSNYAVVLRESPGADGRFSISITRVLGTGGFFTACYPDCSHATYRFSAVSFGTEFENVTLGLTSAANVTLPDNSQRPSIGLLREDLRMSGNLSVQFHWENLSGGSVVHQEWFNASTAADTTGSFSANAPLGLFPSSLFGPGSWSSTADLRENLSTNFSGYAVYAGDLIPGNHTGFGGVSVPISPVTTRIIGTDRGTASRSGISAADEALALASDRGGASLLDGAILVPTSAYLFASFDSSCDLAQRPCVANSSTPELDVRNNTTAPIGWDGAVSSVSAFALLFDDRAVYDTPNGATFWPAAAGLPAGPLPAVGPTPATVVGVPMPVPQAQAIQRALHPPSLGPPGGGPPPPAPLTLPAHPLRSGGTPASPFSPAGPSAASGPALELLLVGLGVAGVIASGVAVVRRKRPGSPPPDPPPDEESTSKDAEGSGDDPIGYAW